MKTFEEVVDLAMKTRDKRGILLVKQVLAGFGVTKLNDLNPSDYDKVFLRLSECLPRAISAYAYNSTVPAAPCRAITEAGPYEAMAKHYEGIGYPDAPRSTAFAQEIRAPYGGFPAGRDAKFDGANEAARQLMELGGFKEYKVILRRHGIKKIAVLWDQPEKLDAVLRELTEAVQLRRTSLRDQDVTFVKIRKQAARNAMFELTNGTPPDGDYTPPPSPLDALQHIESREQAKALVQVIQKQWDLVDDAAVLATLINNMEDRHGEEFNQFFEATLRRVMLDNGLKRVVIKASDMLQDFGTVKFVELSEEPGLLVYSLTGDDLNA